MKNNVKLALSGLFLALAYVLPFLTGQVPAIGNMLCPMHVPVLLCGFICGWKYGGIVGASVPLLRSLTLGMPLLFPQAVCMSVELCTYGILVGFMFSILPKKLPYIYISLITAMFAGRLVWGSAMLVCLFAKGSEFDFSMFIAGAFTNAIPGIILQLVLIPAVIMTLKKANLPVFENGEPHDEKRNDNSQYKRL